MQDEKLENYLAFRSDIHTVMSAGNNDPVEHLASILVPRTNRPISNDRGSPGSAPSVLLPMHNPFDIPYETHEERPDLT